MNKNRFAIKKILQAYPVFLLTIPLSFFIHTANYYFGLLIWKYILIDCLIYLAVPFLLYFILGKLFRSYQKAAALLAFPLILFYFFYLLYDGLKSYGPLSFIAQYSILLPCIAICLSGYAFYILKKIKTYRLLINSINTVFLLLCAGGLIQFLFLLFSDSKSKYDHGDPGKTLTKNYIPCDTCEKPDIYFLLFDGYTNSKTLSAEFSYTNNELESRLRKDSFYIPEKSISNYNFTHMSMGSALNMAYLKKLKEGNRFFTKDFFEANYTTYHNELCAILEKQGYETANFSIFDIKNYQSKITPAITELTWRSVMGQTFFNKILRDIGWHFAGLLPENYISASKKKKEKDDLKRINETLDGITETAKRQSGKPRFLYAHFLMPHETYYFDSLGNRLDQNKTFTTLVNKDDYLQQVVYTNKFIMQPAIDSIFKYARRPFAIIIQSDHGFRNYPIEKVHLEFENFSAVYFSDQDYSAIPDSLSMANTFRIVLNKYFKQKMPLLKDSTINLYK